MNTQIIWNVISSLLGVAGIIGAFYAYAQVRLIREERARRETEERELADWSVRAQDVVQKLIALAPRWWQGGEGFSQCPLYPMIVPPELRGLVEIYLIHLNPSTSRAEARTLTPDMLRLTVVRDTIKRVEDCFESIRKKSSLIAKQASL